MEQQENTGIGWFIAGLGVGALLGILFAPKTGREMREGLLSTARDSKEQVTAKGKQAREQINSMVDRGRDQINDYAERGKQVAERGRERWEGVVDRVAGKHGDNERGYTSRDEEEAHRGGAAENTF